MMARTVRVFLTGATGVMGMAGLRELTGPRNDGIDYRVTVLARDSKKNRKTLEPFAGSGVSVIWGDLLDPNAVARGVENADIVLHVGAMVSPMADKYPELCYRTNTGAARNITEAIINSGRDIKLVYIGSVSQYGFHPVPDHWGDASTQQTPVPADAYAHSKCDAEKIVAASGLKHWVSLRQTGILHPALITRGFDPITFHVPLDGVLEWVTVEDSGRLLERVCRPEVPESFWGKAYNIGGGKPYRLTNLEFERMFLKALGCPPPERIFETDWFATHSFHGMWFTDSDALEDILHFRGPEGPEEWFGNLAASLPWFYRLTPLAPAWVIKAFMKRIAMTPVRGTLWAVKTGNTEKIEEFFGSLQERQAIPSWHDRTSDSLPPLDTDPPSPGGAPNR